MWVKVSIINKPANNNKTSFIVLVAVVVWRGMIFWGIDYIVLRMNIYFYNSFYSLPSLNLPLSILKPLNILCAQKGQILIEYAFCNFCKN